MTIANKIRAGKKQKKTFIRNNQIEINYILNEIFSIEIKTDKKQQRRNEEENKIISTKSIRD